jgi:glycosyltransferase involved in cell wall biosynthesis
VRVAIDTRKLFDGGIGTYIRGLLGALAVSRPQDEWIALVDQADRGRVRWPGTVQERPVRAGKYGIAEHFAVPAEARRAGAELLHSPHYTLPLAWRGPSVVTIHDLIHIRFARFHRPGAAAYARAVAGLAARRARVVIADSEATKRDVVELLRAPGEKVRVVPLGVSSAIHRVSGEAIARFRAERVLPEGYVLYVGARKRHKNLELLLRAWAAMHVAERPPLVLSGPAWTSEDPTAALAHTLGVAGVVRFAGDLRDEDELSCLYGGASLLVQPSLAEGFGLPPLEAMACGVPVLSSDAGALPEVLADAAESLPPREPAAWAAAVVRLLSDRPRREELIARGVQRAARFTWERTAAATHAIYAEALSTRSRP